MNAGDEGRGFRPATFPNYMKQGRRKKAKKKNKYSNEIRLEIWFNTFPPGKAPGLKVEKRTNIKEVYSYKAEKT